MKRFLLLVISFYFLIVPLAAQRQEKPTGPQRPQKHWFYNLSFGGEIKSGSVNTTIYKNNGSIERNDSLLALSASYGIIYGKKDGVVYDRSLSASFKADLWQHDKWSPFVLNTYLNNKFKGFEYKSSFLIGAKYRIYTIPGRCDYSISAAYMSDWVQYFKYDKNGNLVDDHRLKPQVSRLSFRFKIKQRISDIINIKHMTFYQPSLMEMDGFKSWKEDYVITSTTTFENKIGKMIFLDINFIYEYRSIVPKTVTNTDIITSAALRVKF